VPIGSQVPQRGRALAGLLAEEWGIEMGVGVGRDRFPPRAAVGRTTTQVSTAVESSAS